MKPLLQRIAEAIKNAPVERVIVEQELRLSQGIDDYPTTVKEVIEYRPSLANQAKAALSVILPELAPVRDALETAERLADDKGSDLQYEIIAKGVLAFRATLDEVMKECGK